MRLWYILSALALPAFGVPLKNDGSEINEEVERKPNDLSWEQWHMQREHQMETYEPETFFTLHDIGNKGYFDRQDILTMYGLNRDEVVGSGDGMGKHDNSEQIDQETSDRVFQLVMELLDVDDDSKIEKQEYLDFAKRGGQLPDLGVGVGHHSDFELEYELHHWNKYHMDKDPDVKVVHKEDVAHDLLHHEHKMEHEDQVQQGASRVTVVTDDELEARIKLENIPQKFKNGF
ncbi:nucleobindin SSP120 [Lachancea thermotolerans CBS 6340]|uniref:KLTH0H11946p n=1 Tax=Lachancea thermotolerans (strain ATCC 56472 / CBS 6340 / NRRL Y-8284) TaxID=559295 RepID=C5E3B4_LACTC|nr:KLTH0H11946p [Lachancea thermotolerans CBS 6340]CAR30525.1 KLTH0H11946p [Lachancea thermotolerans CBS 6340]